MLLQGLVRLSLLPALIVFVSPHAVAQQSGTWAPEMSMPTPRGNLAVGTVNGILYAVGGYQNGAGALDTVEAYDPTSNTWLSSEQGQLQPMPTPRNGVSVGVVNGILYAVGGDTDGGATGYLSTVEAYDPTTGVWMATAPMSTPRMGVGVGVINNLLYAIGGQYPNLVALSTAEAYDPVTNAWTSVAPMPTPRYQVGGGVVNGIFYAVGGQDALTVFPVVEAYDPVANHWTTKQPMPHARAGMGVAVVNGILYAIGGYGDCTFPCQLIEAYDPMTDSWSTISPMMPTGRYLLAAGVVKGQIFAVGGAGSGGYLSTVEAFTPSPMCGQASYAGATSGNLTSLNPANGWTMNYRVSDGLGLVLSDIRLGPRPGRTPPGGVLRYMAKEFSLPHYLLTTPSGTTRCKLRSNGTDPLCRSRLVSLKQGDEGDALVIEATYAVDQLPDDASRSACLMLKQRYEFHVEYTPISPQTSCELSGTYPCAKFFPKVSYEITVPSGANYTPTIETIQRLYFVDSKGSNPVSRNVVAIFHDCNLSIEGAHCLLLGRTDAVVPVFGDPIPQEVAATIILNGNIAGQSDNYHQTYMHRVSEPKIYFKPGCPECVHIHWRWSSFFDGQFGSGKPLIPQGSTQTVQIAVVQATEAGGIHDREDPDPFDALATGTPLSLLGPRALPVLWYGASSDQKSDTFFDHGGFFSSVPP